MLNWQLKDLDTVEKVLKSLEAEGLRKSANRKMFKSSENFRWLLERTFGFAPISDS